MDEDVVGHVLLVGRRRLLVVELGLLVDLLAARHRQVVLLRVESAPLLLPPPHSLRLLRRPSPPSAPRAAPLLFSLPQAYYDYWRKPGKADGTPLMPTPTPTPLMVEQFRAVAPAPAQAAQAAVAAK